MGCGEGEGGEGAPALPTTPALISLYGLIAPQPPLPTLLTHKKERDSNSHGGGSGNTHTYSTILSRAKKTKKFPFILGYVLHNKLHSLTFMKVLLLGAN